MSHVTTLPYRRGLFFVIVAAIAWGTGGPAGALLAGADLSPVAISFWRFTGGALLLLPILLLRRTTTRMNLHREATVPVGPTTRHRVASVPVGARRGAGRTTRHRVVSVPVGGRRGVGPVRRRRFRPRGPLVTGPAMAVCQAAYFGAIDQSGVTVATMVTMGATPVLVTVGGLLAGRRPGRVTLACTVLAVAGVGLLTGGPGQASVAGVGLALLSALAYAVVTLLSGQDGDPIASAVGGFAVGAVCLLPVALVTGIVPGDPVRSAAVLVFLAAVPTALAYGLFFTGLRVVDASAASILSLLEPLVAAVIGFTLLGERLSPSQAAGAALLVAAVAVISGRRS